MEAFSITGVNDFVKITFEEVYTLPEGTCAIGGFEVRATLEIRSEGSLVKADLFTATGEIYEFYEKLKKWHAAGNGSVHFRTYKGHLDLELAYADAGKVIVSGAFTGHNPTAGKLEFEFGSDPTAIWSTLTELKAITEKYGDTRGKRKGKAD